MCEIPGNPDIAGIGVRIAIYIQNILSFGPAFYSLFNDRKVDRKELRTVEKQSTTILITAFAILISLIVQALAFNLSAFHTSIVLNLSWMNNTNTFIYTSITRATRIEESRLSRLNGRSGITTLHMLLGYVRKRSMETSR
jgi:hypothetical protein